MTINLGLDAKELETLQEIADEMPFMAWMTSADGAAQFVNSSWCRFTGLGVDESLGFGWGAALDPEKQAEAQARWISKVRQGIPNIDPLRYRRADGVFVIFVSKTWPIMDSNGIVFHWLGIAIDPDDLTFQAMEDGFIKLVRGVFTGAGNDLTLVTD
ncbi:MAG: PAS domain-containing protein [Candidatus Eremiobacteraeota bacterium]|nr:PAS domain-containing protein [Candidatus Eremiobacteraeota bacterium]